MVFLRGPLRVFIGIAAFAVTASGGCSTSPREELGRASQDIELGCSKHKDCDEGNPCTQDLCVAGLCLPPLPVLGCCFEGNCFEQAGGAGGASAGAAGATSNGGATEGLDCSTQAQCDDGDACTENLCAVGLCVTLPVLGCVLGGDGGATSGPLSCSIDDACEDGHPCTENLCVAGLCVGLPVLGCCFNGQCAGEGGAGGQAGSDAQGGAGTGGSATGLAGSTGGPDHGGTTGNEGGHDGAGAVTNGPGAGGAGDDPTSSVAGAAASSSDTGVAGAAQQPSGDHTEWVMEGGSCSVSAPGGGSRASLALLGLALAGIFTRRRRRLAALSLAAPLALSASARAEGFSQDAYTAPVAPEDLLWTERAGSDPGSLRPFGRLTLGYTDDPLVLVDATDSGREIRVIDSQVALYGGFGIGFAHRAHLALLMPLYLQNSGASFTGSSIEGARPGDLGIDGRFTLLDRHAPLELALAATLRVPTGDRAAYASDGRVSAWPRVLVSKQVTKAGTLFNLSLGPAFRASGEQSSLKIGSQLRFTAGTLIALSEVVGVTAEAAGSTHAEEPFHRRNTPIEGGLGGRITLPSVILASGISTGLSRGVGAPDFRWLVSVAVPGPAAPPAPAPKPVVDDDPDRDGVRGSADACPTQPEDMDGFNDQDGCPELDNDADGIADLKDKCPTVAEDSDGFEDGDGCPDLDNDGDGIGDANDKCPSQAEDVDQWQDEDGCPEDDNDADGVLDAQDKCPTEAETKNGVDDEDGCPDLLRIEAGQIRTLEPIFFDYNKASIQSRSAPLLLEMANLIRTRPDLGVIVIEGHTDARGSAKYNLTLSRDRAAAVRSFLVQNGVAEERLTSDGFGSTRPIDDNKNDAGRARNRRVEFHFGAPSAAP